MRLQGCDLSAPRVVPACVLVRAFGKLSAADCDVHGSKVGVSAQQMSRLLVTRCAITGNHTGLALERDVRVEAMHANMFEGNRVRLAGEGLRAAELVELHTDRLHLVMSGEHRVLRERLDALALPGDVAALARRERVERFDLVLRPTSASPLERISLDCPPGGTVLLQPGLYVLRRPTVPVTANALWSDGVRVVGRGVATLFLEFGVSILSYGRGVVLDGVRIVKRGPGPALLVLRGSVRLQACRVGGRVDLAAAGADNFHDFAEVLAAFAPLPAPGVNGVVGVGNGDAEAKVLVARRASAVLLACCVHGDVAFNFANRGAFRARGEPRPINGAPNAVFGCEIAGAIVAREEGGGRLLRHGDNAVGVDLPPCDI